MTTADDESSVEWLDVTGDGSAIIPVGAPVLDAPPTISCRQVVKVYRSVTGRVQAVRGVDLDLEAGSVTGIVGPSGSGKSSLLRMIGALDEPTAGLIEIAGADLFALPRRRRARRRGELITHVHQRPSDNLLGHLSARQQLERILADDDDPGRVDDVLEQLGLIHRRDHLPAEMSGGEQQRLALARSVVARHRLVIADEPTAQLDPASAESVLDTIGLLADAGTTVVVATHDVRVLPRMSQVVALRDGAVASITQGGSELVVIDRSGRLQLPPEIRRRFPERRAELVWDDETGELRVRRP